MACQAVKINGDAAVLVDDVELVELPERTSFEGVSRTHVVGLKGFYDSKGSSRQSCGLVFERLVVRGF
jgi:hypothetical protein